MHRRKKHKAEGSAGVQLSMIITPMLDMSFQILAFFIMTYHPSALEGHIPGSLVPPDNYAKTKKDSKDVSLKQPDIDPPISVPEEDLNPELQTAITVKIKPVVKGQEYSQVLEGRISQLFVISKKPEEKDLEEKLVAEIFVNKQNRPSPTDKQLDQDYKTELRKAIGHLDASLKGLIKDGSATPKTHLKIVADNDTKQQFVMLVYDTARKSGFDFDRIHFISPPILNAKLK